MIRPHLPWLFCLVVSGWGVGSIGAQEPQVESTTDLVGRSREEYIVTPVNQLLTPYGRQVELAGLRPQALALSPDGQRLMVSGKTSELLVIDIERAEVVQRVVFPGDDQKEPPQVVSPNILKPDKSGQVSFTGLVFSPDGKRIYCRSRQMAASSMCAGTSRTSCWKSIPPRGPCCGRGGWGWHPTTSPWLMEKPSSATGLADVPVMVI